MRSMKPEIRFYSAEWLRYVARVLLCEAARGTFGTVPSFSRIFAHTTMTHFSFWGRYQEPNIKLKYMDEGET